MVTSRLVADMSPYGSAHAFQYTPVEEKIMHPRALLIFRKRLKIQLVWVNIGACDREVTWPGIITCSPSCVTLRSPRWTDIMTIPRCKYLKRLMFLKIQLSRFNSVLTWTKIRLNLCYQPIAPLSIGSWKTLAVFQAFFTVQFKMLICRNKKTCAQRFHSANSSSDQLVTLCNRT